MLAQHYLEDDAEILALRDELFGWRPGPVTSRRCGREVDDVVNRAERLAGPHHQTGNATDGQAEFRRASYEANGVRRTQDVGSAGYHVICAKLDLQRIGSHSLNDVEI